MPLPSSVPRASLTGPQKPQPLLMKTTGPSFCCQSVHRTASIKVPCFEDSFLDRASPTAARLPWNAVHLIVAPPPPPTERSPQVGERSLPQPPASRGSLSAHFCLASRGGCRMHSAVGEVHSHRWSHSFLEAPGNQVLVKQKLFPLLQLAVFNGCTEFTRMSVPLFAHY